MCGHSGEGEGETNWKTRVDIYTLTACQVASVVSNSLKTYGP